MPSTACTCLSTIEDRRLHLLVVDPTCLVHGSHEVSPLLDSSASEAP